MEQRFCQSCGMPLTEEVLGTNGRSSESHPSLLEDGPVVRFYSDFYPRSFVIE